MRRRFHFPSGAVPLLVKSDAYRPIKVDGNPEHPYNQGGSDPITQATLLDLYDPDRSQHVVYRGETRTWPAFLAEFPRHAGGQEVVGRAGTVFPERDGDLADDGRAVEEGAGDVIRRRNSFSTTR